MTAAPHKPLAYIPHIDGLRAVAVLIVLLYHLDVTVFKGGFIGVDVFFVISGYLITKLIARDMAAGSFSFGDFYARRVKRIFPALFAMLFVSSAAAIVFLGMSEYTTFFKALRGASGQIANIKFSEDLDYFDNDNSLNPLLHTWSLGVEEQFYLLWPLLLLLVHKFLGLRRSTLVLGLVTIISLAVSEYLVRTDALSAFYLLHSRAWELAVGGLIGLNALPVLRRRWAVELAAFAGCAMILAAALLYTPENFPGVKALLPCLGAALFIYAAQEKAGWAHKALSAPALVAIGLVSYSLYLWHWPFIAFYKSYYTPDLSLVAQIAIGVLSLIAAYLSYKFVEQPLRRVSWAPRKVIATGLATIAIFIVSANLIKDQNDAPWRVTYKADDMILTVNSYYKACAKEGGAYNKKDCIIGPNKDTYEVLLTGDSHAAHYVPAVLAWAESRGLTVRLFLREACKTFIVNERTPMRYGRPDTGCTDLSGDLHETLTKDTHIQHVFLALMLGTGNDTMEESLQKIKSYNKDVYYLGNVPIFPENPHECHFKSNLMISRILPRPHDDCFAIDETFSEKKAGNSRTAMLPLLEKTGIPYFDPLPFMKTALDAEGRFMYVDDNHLNTYGALHLAPHLRDFITRHAPTAAKGRTRVQ